MSERRSGFTVIEVVIVLVLIILLIGLSLPSTGKGHRSAVQQMARNNLMQVGLALHSHHDVMKRLPFNGTPDNWGSSMSRDSGSWAYQILPYIEQNHVHRAGVGMKSTVIPTLLCPARERPGFMTEGKYAGSVTDYAINTWLNDSGTGSISVPDRGAKIHMIADGTSNTYMVGQLALPEKEHFAVDAAPGRETIFVGGTTGTGRNGGQLQQDAKTLTGGMDFGSPFPGAAFFCMGDGSIRRVSYGVNLLPGLRPNDAQPAQME